jgi:hypothetical protein
MKSSTSQVSPELQEKKTFSVSTNKKKLLHRILDFFTPENNGSYSIERLYAFYEFSMKSSFFNVFFECFFLVRAQ